MHLSKKNSYYYQKYTRKYYLKSFDVVVVLFIFGFQSYMNKNTFKISIENSTFTLTKCKKCESECSVGEVATCRRQLIILLPLTL